MLGLLGFVMLAVLSAFGELQQAVETTATRAWCGGCGVAAQPHGRRLVRVRDLLSPGRRVVLLWLKRLWRCAEPACSVADLVRGQRAVARHGVSDRSGAPGGVPAGQ